MSDTRDPATPERDQAVRSGVDPADRATAYGGTTGVEPMEPGQSLGQVPQHDDDDVDEAGDRPERSGSLPPDDAPTAPE